MKEIQRRRAKIKHIIYKSKDLQRCPRIGGKLRGSHVEFPWDTHGEFIKIAKCKSEKKTRIRKEERCFGR